MSKTSTKTRSRTIFITADTARNARGTTEFPKALSKKAKKLYKNVAAMPVKIIIR